MCVEKRKLFLFIKLYMIIVVLVGGVDYGDEYLEDADAGLGLYYSCCLTQIRGFGVERDSV